MKRNIFFVLSFVSLFGCGTHRGHPDTSPAGSSYFNWSSPPGRPRRLEGFRDVASEPSSTFAADVDTASYALARKALGLGWRPDPSRVRIEEFVNAFSYDYPAPAEGETLALSSEVSSVPWYPSRRLVRIGVRAASKAEAAVKRNFVFLVDVSGSMAEAAKLPLVKQSLRRLIDTLGKDDHVALVTYAAGSQVVLPPVSGDFKAEIGRAVDGLEARGATNGGEGIRQAYELARRSYTEGGVNRVILCTDGDFNVGVQSETALVELVRGEANAGIGLTVLGFGASGNDFLMEYLADNGDGNYGYVDSLEEAERLLVTEASATLETAAKDVKIQVTFNPAAVRRYRLLGYEDRRLTDAAFDDDRRDAGEMGYGASVTALYEIEPTANTGVKLLDVTVRYQAESSPGITQERQLEVQDVGKRLHEASADQRFSAAVVWFALILRGDGFVSGNTGSDVEALATRALGSDTDGRRAKFAALASGLDRTYRWAY